MLSITLERLWMVSDRIVNFRVFVKFDKSGPAIIFSFLSYHARCLVIHQKSSKSSKRLHQDGEYYSGRIMDGLIEL